MAFLRSALFALFFYPGTLLIVLAAFPAGLLGRRAVQAVATFWAWWHRWCARLLLGVRTRVEGIVPDQPVLIAAKHQSMFETIEVLMLLDRPILVMKKELTAMPLWGAIARQYGIIPVDREGGSAALRTMLRAAQAAVAAGRQVLIFPEGTRVAPGEQPPLQPGFAGLYKSLGLPVIPVALDSGRLWPRHRFVKRAGWVTMRFGAPIPPGLPRREIEPLVHAGINALENERGRPLPDRPL